MLLDQLLVQLGVGVGSNFIYDLTNRYFESDLTPTKAELETHIAASLEIKNADIAAARIVSFFAENGDLIIEGSSIYAADSITLASTAGTKFSMSNSSVSKTKNTEINVGEGAQIIGTGGTRIVQGDDGSISFFT